MNSLLKSFHLLCITFAAAAPYIRPVDLSQANAETMHALVEAGDSPHLLAPFVSAAPLEYSSSAYAVLRHMIALRRAASFTFLFDHIHISGYDEYGLVRDRVHSDLLLRALFNSPEIAQAMATLHGMFCRNVFDGDLGEAFWDPVEGGCRCWTEDQLTSLLNNAPFLAKHLLPIPAGANLRSSPQAPMPPSPTARLRAALLANQDDEDLAETIQRLAAMGAFVTQEMVDAFQESHPEHELSLEELGLALHHDPGCIL
jgi:hypothetical protein